MIRNIKTVKTPRGVYPTKDGKYLYVAGYDKGELQKINLTDLTSKILYNQGKALRHIVVDESKNIMYISDMGNNRVLIYNSIPTTNYAPADVVIGQKDFNTHDTGAPTSIPPGSSPDHPLPTLPL